MESGIVRGLTEQGALVNLGSAERQRPMKIPRGMDLMVGDRVLVEQVSGQYWILGVYGGDENGG